MASPALGLCFPSNIFVESRVYAAIIVRLVEQHQVLCLQAKTTRSLLSDRDTAMLSTHADYAHRPSRCDLSENNGK